MQVAPEKPVGTSLWFERALLPGGWAHHVRLTVADGVITEVQTGTPPHERDERGQVAVPGLANLHSHAFQRGMAGLTERRGPAADSFWTWREIMYRFLDRLSPEGMETIAALAYAEMLETGFTRVGEFHYVHHDPNGQPYANLGELAGRICAAAQETGINLTLLPSFYAHANFGGLPPTAGQRRFVTTPGQFARLFDAARRAVADVPGATLGVAPHSLRAVTPAELAEVAALCPDGPIHIHAAEQTREVEDCTAFTGQRPVEWLLDHAPLDRRWCLIHATHLTDDETRRLARSGATVGLCPVTEANLGDGVFPALPFLAEGGRVGIGTDSNVNIHAPTELCLLEYAQRLTRRGRNLLASREGASTGRSLFDLAHAGGNRALLCAGDGLAVGSPADIVEWSDDYAFTAAYQGDDGIFDRYIFGGGKSCRIETVWVRGKRVVEGGRHVRREPILRRFQDVLRELLVG